MNSMERADRVLLLTCSSAQELGGQCHQKQGKTSTCTQQTWEMSHHRMPQTQKGSGEPRGHVFIPPLPSHHLLHGCHLKPFNSCYGGGGGRINRDFPWLQISVIIFALILPTSKHVFSRLSSSLFGSLFTKGLRSCAFL